MITDPQSQSNHRKTVAPAIPRARELMGHWKSATVFLRCVTYGHANDHPQINAIMKMHPGKVAITLPVNYATTYSIGGRDYELRQLNHTHEPPIPDQVLIGLWTISVEGQEEAMLRLVSGDRNGPRWQVYRNGIPGRRVSRYSLTHAINDAFHEYTNPQEEENVRLIATEKQLAKERDLVKHFRKVMQRIASNARNGFEIATKTGQQLARAFEDLTIREMADVLNEIEEASAATGRKWKALRAAKQKKE